MDRAAHQLNVIFLYDFAFSAGLQQFDLDFMANICRAGEYH